MSVEPRLNIVIVIIGTKYFIRFSSEIIFFFFRHKTIKAAATIDDDCKWFICLAGCDGSYCLLDSKLGLKTIFSKKHNPMRKLGSNDTSHIMKSCSGINQNIINSSITLQSTVAVF